MIKKIFVAIAFTATFSGVVLASCPPHLPYGCSMGYNGKQICGCGQ
jgi:hypothetical protein